MQKIVPQMIRTIKSAALRACRLLRSAVLPLRTLNRKNARWTAGPLLSIIVSSRTDGEDRRRLFDWLRKQSFRDFEIVLFDDELQTVRTVFEAQLNPDTRPTEGQAIRREPVGGQMKGHLPPSRGRYIWKLQDYAVLDSTFVEKALFLLESYNFDAIYGTESASCDTLPPVIFRCARSTASSGRTRFNRKQVIAGRFQGLFRHSRVLRGAVRDERPARLAKLSLSDSIVSAIVKTIKFRVEGPFINLFGRSGRQGRSILFAIPHAVIGGADAVLVGIAKHLKQLSFDIYVVATMAVPPELGDSSGQYKATVDAFYNMPEFLETKEEYADFVGYLMEAKGIDTIFQVGSEVVYQLLPALKRKNPRVRVIDQLFNEVVHLPNNRRFAEYIDCTIVTNDAIKRKLVEEYLEQEKKVKVIVHGVDTRGEFDPIRYSNECAVRAAAQGGEFTVSYCGRISEEKGPDLFLEIARRLLDIPEIRFVMTGNGPLLPQITARAAALGLSGRIQMPGFVDDVRAQLIQSDVVVVPSRIEGIPIILLEALSFGIPVIAAGVGGIPSIITDGFNGFVCAREDVQTFVEKIRRLHADRGLRDSIASNARAFALERLDKSRMLAEYGSVFA
jgi:glycosyltransferase involved in cell wall biosynthesis